MTESRSKNWAKPCRGSLWMHSGALLAVSGAIFGRRNRSVSSGSSSWVPLKALLERSWAELGALWANNFWESDRRPTVPLGAHV
eukprot:2569853-Pyramimonas_sp.AAC.1